MPLLILIGMLLIYFAVSVSEEIGNRVKPLTKEELEDIDKKMRGKSSDEQRKILKKYRGIGK